MFPSVASFLASSITSLEIILSKFLVMVAIPLSNEAWAISTRLTLYPFWAKTWAIPLPMVPAPITAIFSIVCCLK